jgi:hypothetical protein
MKTSNRIEMRHFRIGVTFLLTGGFGIGSSACDPPRPGTLVGDVYLAEDPSSEQSLPNIEVRLVQNLPQIDSLLLLICPDSGRVIFADTAARRRAWETRNNILRDHVVRTTIADSGASFVFDSVPRGTYRLWADTVIGDRIWTWRSEVFVPARGITTRHGLTNLHADEDPFLCYRDRVVAPNVWGR